MIENFIPQGFISKHDLCTQPEASDLIFHYSENNLLLLKTRELPKWQDIQPLVLNKQIDLYCFGEFQSQRCLLIEQTLPELSSHKTFIFYPARFCHEALGEPWYRIAGLGRQLQYWRSTQIYCGHCGSKTIEKKDERAKLCPQCQHISYPQLHPCVIVLVARGPELLLARSPHFNTGIYSTLAGFIEPGESAENAVFREVKEEVNISIKNIRYVLSQPWPFPNSLMLGFLADYESGELMIDKLEIEDAQWFDPAHLPKLPSPLSISRLLIQKHMQQYTYEQ